MSCLWHLRWRFLLLGHTPIMWGCIIWKSCLYPYCPSVIDIGLHPLEAQLSCLVSCTLVAKYHLGNLIVVYVQREVQPVCVVVLDVIVQILVVPYLILDDPVEAFQFPVGLQSCASIPTRKSFCSQTSRPQLMHFLTLRPIRNCRHCRVQAGLPRCPRLDCLVCDPRAS